MFAPASYPSLYEAGREGWPWKGQGIGAQHTDTRVSMAHAFLVSLHTQPEPHPQQKDSKTAV
jgi:hypothetical protein